MAEVATLNASAWSYLKPRTYLLDYHRKIHIPNREQAAVNNLQEDSNQPVRSELQIDGLCQTGSFLRELIEREAKEFTGPGDDRYRRIILGGLSQGCAAGIFTFLAGLFGEYDSSRAELSEGKPVGGFVGMSDWLPLNGQLEEIFQFPSGDVSDHDPFAQSSRETDEGSDNEDNNSAELQAINHIRDILDLPALPAFGAQHRQSPVFIPRAWLDVDVTWRVYEEFGHWYKVPDEIDEIVKFLKERVACLFLKSRAQNSTHNSLHIIVI
ncbi:hypothetical protein ACJ73_03123, partial [Blastomyces percursus]